jgi:hypothetical protein
MHKPALFLPAAKVARSSGRLALINNSTVMGEVCRLVGIEGRAPHSARHGMGVQIIQNTDNPARPHTSSATSMQYMQFTQEELLVVLGER